MSNMYRESIFPCKDVFVSEIQYTGRRTDESLQRGTRLATETKETTRPEMEDGRSSVSFGVPDNSTNNQCLFQWLFIEQIIPKFVQMEKKEKL